MNKSLSIILLLLIFVQTTSKVISTNNLKSALTQAVAGDIIELKSGFYRDAPYTLKSGSKGNPIKIKSASKATVVFEGTKTSCIINGDGVSNVIIEGPMELMEARCGVNIRNGNSITISGLTIKGTQEYGITVSGKDNHIYNNTIYDCVLSNSHYPEDTLSGWTSCLYVFGASYGEYSSNIIVEKNNIYNGYGEGIDIFECDNCKVIKNNIKNAYNISIFVHESKNIIVDRNVIRVNSDRYDSYYGRACGIGLTSPSSRKLLTNIVISNNIILSTRIGILFFSKHDEGGYDEIKILHNTLWKVKYTPIQFKYPINDPTGCEMKNNFIYVDGTKEFELKNYWSFGYNYYYNVASVPSIYSDPTSKAAKSLDISSIFNKIKGCDNYDTNENIDINCFHPSKTPGTFKLYHSGIPSKYKIHTDYSSCTRSTSTPSIGAFEYQEGCSTGPDPDDSDVPFYEYDVKFKIKYCIPSSYDIKLSGSFCNYNIENSISMKSEGSCVYSATIQDATAESFSYKFVLTYENSPQSWEDDPFRKFNGPALASLADKSASGTYENCSYTRSGNLITLQCSWQ